MKNGKYGISDVAEMLGVSKSTVSRVINGNEGVGPELRKKVMDFINEIGYQPNTIAQSLSKGRMNIVALILGDIRNPFYADLTFNIQRILNDNGYMVMVLNSEYNIDRELEFLKLTEQFNFAGLILITAQEKAIEERLKNMEMPKVLVNRILPYYTGDSVLIDNFQAGYQATMHLIELGHDRTKRNISTCNKNRSSYTDCHTNRTCISGNEGSKKRYTQSTCHYSINPKKYYKQ